MKLVTIKGKNSVLSFRKDKLKNYIILLFCPNVSDFGRTGHIIYIPVVDFW